MDPRQFDRLVQALGRATSRRTTLVGFLTGLFAALPDDETTAKPKRNRRDRGQDRDKNQSRDQDRLQAEGRGKKRRKKKKKRGGGSGGGQTEPPPAECCGTESCPDPERGGTSAGCNYAGRSFAGQDLNGSIFRGIDGREANFNQTDNRGSIFAEACLQGATFRRARLDGSTWEDACLFDADFTEADFDGDLTLFDNALFCNTVMPDGSVNDRDCERATTCCRRDVEPLPECQNAGDCADQPCQTKACQNGQCVYDEVFSGPSPNDLCTFCCDNDCCLSPANQCNTQNGCCAPNCEGRVCGPDGCGGDGSCGPCSVQAGRRCTPEGQCVCDAVSCPDGCCDAEADCWPGDSNQRCGPPGGTCATCTGRDVCRNGQCVCVPDCAGKDCGPDGCGSNCGSCTDGQRCQDGECVCDAVSCANGCCANGPGNPGACRSGNADRACGDGGEQCVQCADHEECDDGACVPIVCTGDCSDNADCPDAANCVCNEETGACCTRNCTVDRVFPKVCGSDGCGGSCGTCPDGTVCNMTGSACICTPDSCPSGCCDVPGVCRPNSDATCGVNGAICQACPTGLACRDDGLCVCTPQSCPDGCCASETGPCVSPPTGAQCGVAGAACQQCPGSLNECLEPICSAAGICGLGDVPASTPCSVGGEGICCQGDCSVNNPENCEACGVSCPPPANQCQVAVCTDRVCGAANGPDNAQCQTANGAGVCCDGACCDGHCCNGVCCDEPCCGETCCGAGQSCCNGVCCDQPCCDGVCCGPGQPCCSGVCCCGTGEIGQNCCGDNGDTCCFTCEGPCSVCCGNDCRTANTCQCGDDEECCSGNCADDGFCRPAGV